MLELELWQNLSISDWASIASAIALAITIPLITWQIREQTKFRKLEAYNHLYDRLSSGESSKARRIVFDAYYKGEFNKSYDQIRSDQELRDAIDKVRSDYDLIGKLVFDKDIPQDFALEMYGGSAYRMYDILKEYNKIDYIKRNKDLPWDIDHYKYFVELAFESEEWFDKHKSRVRKKPHLW